MAKPTAPGTLVSMTDFHFKGFGLTYFCFESEKTHFFIKEDNTLNADNIVHWLEVSKYSPSAFSIVQDLLNASGQEYDARRIGFIDKSIQAQAHWNDFKKGNIRAIPPIAVSTFTRWFIGYGYCIYAAAIWAVGLLVFGTFVFWLIPSDGLVEDKSQEHKGQTPEAPSLRSDISPLAYSFDMLLPLVKLRERHYEIKIKPWFPRNYFYVHKILGYVLGLFLLAGLSGLTR